MHVVRIQFAQIQVMLRVLQTDMVFTSGCELGAVNFVEERDWVCTASR
jgi:hypothetical protein